ncbi:MAG: AAA family ATPase [Phycisphaerae bacterium]|nr:AAA family ATPase [Phycisphaerae bacterium]
MKTVAVINQKGGVGKTTSVANLGAAIAMRGPDVCLMDIDPQAHLSLHYGLEPDETTATIFDVLAEESTLPNATKMLTPNLWLLPSTTDLAAAESTLAGHTQRNHLLQKSLTAQSLPHDFILIDCPPSLGLLTLNALVAADDVLIPLQPHFLALQGLAKLLETIQLVQQRVNPRLRVLGVLLCMYESVTKLGKDVVQEVRDFFEAARGTNTPYADARIFQTVIRRNIRLAECPSYGKTIFEYDARSNGATDYNALAGEFLACYGKTEPVPVSPEAALPPDTIAPVPVPPPMPYSSNPHEISG